MTAAHGCHLRRLSACCDVPTAFGPIAIVLLSRNSVAAVRCCRLIMCPAGGSLPRGTTTRNRAGPSLPAGGDHHLSPAATLARTMPNKRLQDMPVASSTLPRVEVHDDR